MSQHYSNPSREDDPHALPNIEVFWLPKDYLDGEEIPAGWFWHACFPGCLPDGDPVGPFDTEAEALADARESNDLDIAELR